MDSRRIGVCQNDMVEGCVVHRRVKTEMRHFDTKVCQNDTIYEKYEMSKKCREKHQETFSNVQKRNTMELYSYYIVPIGEAKTNKNLSRVFWCVTQRACDTASV